jgi:hypothetical protein
VVWGQSTFGGSGDVDDGDDLRYAWALKVPMHLGRIVRPYVSHNLVYAQESPVPLPSFQMLRRLKMSSESKKGTQIYYPFLSKSPGKRIPLTFPQWFGSCGDVPLSAGFVATRTELMLVVSCIIMSKLGIIYPS